MTIEAWDEKLAGAERLVDAPITSDVGFLLAKLRTAGSVLNNQALAGSISRNAPIRPRRRRWGLEAAEVATLTALLHKALWGPTD